MKSNKPMITPIPISKARLKLGELTNKVFRKENIFVLSKSGLPVAAIINMKDFNKLGLMKNRGTKLFGVGTWQGSAKKGY